MFSQIFSSINYCRSGQLGIKIQLMIKLILVDLDINHANITINICIHVVYIQYTCLCCVKILVPFLYKQSPIIWLNDSFIYVNVTKTLYCKKSNFLQGTRNTRQYITYRPVPDINSTGALTSIVPDIYSTGP